MKSGSFRRCVHALSAWAEIELDELTYLLESGSDRIGALDFQQSPTHYVPRQAQQPSLDDLLMAAEKVEQGVPLSPELGQALLHGAALGGARPKVLLEDGDQKGATPTTMPATMRRFGMASSWF